MMLTPNQVSINYFMDQLNIQLKVCSKCNLSLHIDKFSKHSGKEDGLQYACKSCRAEYDKLRRQRIKERNKGIDNPLNLEFKVCCTCKESLLVINFSKHSGNKDGLRDECKSCRAEHYQDNKPEILEQQKEYRKNNPDKIKATSKANQERNRAINLEREKTTYFEDIKNNPKRCSDCKQTKTCADFGRSIPTKDGLHSTCKDCSTKARIDHMVNREKDDPNFKLVNKFKWAFSISLKQGEVIPGLKKLMKKAGIKSIQELMGVKTIQIARKMLLKTIPQGYTEQDWIDKSLHIDHREPLNYFIRLHGDNLKLALIQANQITNLRLITAKDNLRKSNSYALMPDNTELIYEDWVMTKGIKINE